MGGGKGGAKGNGNVQPLPGFSSSSPEHGHLLLPPFGTRPASALTDVAGCAAQAPSGRRESTLPRQKPLTRWRMRDRGSGPAVSVSGSVSGSVRPSSSGLAPGSRSQLRQRQPQLPRRPGPRRPPGCAPTRMRAVLRAAGSLQNRPWGGAGRAGRGEGGAGVGAGVGLPHVGGRTGPAAASAAVFSSARPPPGSPAPRLSHPRTGGRRARRRRLSALP